MVSKHPVRVLAGAFGVTAGSPCAGLGWWLYRRRQASSGAMFQPWDKYDAGASAGAAGAPTNVYANSKFGGRMVYPELDEVEMGSAARAQSPKSFQSVNLKSGRKLDLP